MSLTRREAARLRLRAQRVSGDPGDTPTEVARWMTALQGQDFAAVQWALALRTASPSRTCVLEAFARGELVRSWPMRGTLHVVAAEDLGWMLSLTSERMVASASARRAALGITLRQLEFAREGVIAALQGGRGLSREEIYKVFARSGLDTAGQRGYHALWFLAQTGTVCFGPPEGSAQAIVLVDEWVRHPRRLEGDEALGEWARRYAQSHGPVTVHDFAWWSSLTVTQARRAFEIARGALERRELDGVEHWLGQDAAGGTDGIRLLPAFDEYILGYRDRTPQLDARAMERVVPGRNGVFRAVIVRDGTVVGTWKRSGTGVAPEFFVTPTARLENQVASRARTVERFYDVSR